jgi:hypothetical protein
MSTKRQQIVDALVTRMKGITAVSNRVYIWKDPEDLQVSDMPCIVVRDQRADVEFDDLDGNLRHRLQVSLDYWATGSTAWATAQNGIAAILTAYGTDRTLGGLVTVDELTGHDVGVIRNGNIMAAGTVDLTLTYYSAASTL